MNETLKEVSLGEELASVISSETTIKTLVFLVERSGSPKDIGAAIGISTSNASHHVKKLVKLRLAELIEERDVGGTIQHIYRAIVRPIVSSEEWKKLGLAERQRYSVWIVRMILADAAMAFSAGTFDARTNNHLSRTPVLLDEQGLTELADAQTKLLMDSIQIEAKAIERMAETGEQGMHVISAAMCFELPGPSQGLSRACRPVDVNL